MITSLRCAVLCWVAAGAMGAVASEYIDSWGPALGSQLPGFSLQDATGVTRTASELMGAKGLLVFYNRSADW